MRIKLEVEITDEQYQLLQKAADNAGYGFDDPMPKELVKCFLEGALKDKIMKVEQNQDD